MSTLAHALKKNTRARRNRIRIGRGDSKKGNYGGRGIKGQRARTGGSNRIARRSLMMNLRNLPKNRGFKSLKEKSHTVTLSMLSAAFAGKADGNRVTPHSLLKMGLIPQYGAVKIVSRGQIKVKVTVEGCAVSTGAKEAIEKAGGSVKA